MYIMYVKYLLWQFVWNFFVNLLVMDKSVKSFTTMGNLAFKFNVCMWVLINMCCPTIWHNYWWCWEHPLETCKDPSLKTFGSFCEHESYDNIGMEWTTLYGICWKHKVTLLGVEYLYCQKKSLQRVITFPPPTRMDL